MKSNRHEELDLRRSRVGGLVLLVVLGLCGDIWAQGDLLKRGISLVKASRGIEAERIFLAIGPENADYLVAQTYLGFLLLQRSALPQAEEVFRNVLERQSGNISARLGLESTLMRRGLPSEGGKELKGILTDPSIGPDAKAQWVLSLVYAGRSEEAFQEAQQLAETRPAVAKFHSLLGYLHQVRGETDQALRAYLQSAQLEPGNLSTCFSLINIYRSQKDWGSALHWAQNALALDNNHPLLYQELASIYQNLSRLDEAEAARTEAGRTYDAEILYTQAASARSAGRDGDAERLLRDCTTKNPRLSKAWTDLGELLQGKSRLADALHAFRSALEFSPQDSRAMLGLVTTLQKEGKEEEAGRYLERTGAGGELSPDLLTAMAAGLQKHGKAQDAIAAVLKALDSLPDDPDLFAYLGYLQRSNGRSQEALASYTTALRLNPTQIDAMFGQAQAQLMQGEIRSAIASLRFAQGLDPWNPQILKALLGAYWSIGERESAESACRSCLKIDPKDNECREQLAWLRMEAQDYGDAAAQFQVMLRDGTDSKSILDGLAFALMKMGAYARAIDLSVGSLKRYGPDARVYANLGFLHRCVGNITAAVADYRRARDLAPADAERNGDLGFVLYLARDFSGAVAPLQTALRLKPDWGMGHFHLAMVYWNLGQYRLALSCARIAQEHGIQEAKPVVQSLAKSAGPGIPHRISVRRIRR
jgi:tetratricopeptide (TPR) repeat protein